MTDLKCRTVTVEFRVLAESDAEAAEVVEDVLDRSKDVDQLLAGYNSHTGEAQRGRWDIIEPDDDEREYDGPTSLPIPQDWPVRPIPSDVARGAGVRVVTDVYCGLSWDDGIVTSMTPAPSGRCPFEPFHLYGKDY